MLKDEKGEFELEGKKILFDFKWDYFGSGKERDTPHMEFTSVKEGDPNKISYSLQLTEGA